ncbi:Acetyl esterase Axe7A precursor [Symmachiella dynata]|uniref:Acetyl esterase Axe7A n=1 Tax=Symmachiella dynata TaxID=2527995 RepID=A0A517ZX11_9PLAN|nr:acetylxylan esterase [Symmachiella dynata]QDU46986.1 Acetyl esterase Axe7A precursor [Symmachiella dynata]
MRQRHLLAFVTVLAVALGVTEFALAGKISTVAGTGKPDNNVSQGRSDGVNIGQPFGVELGPDGALYITEVLNHRVWRLDRKTKKLTVVAGNGQKGYSGDGGPATEAMLNEPYEVRFDADGNMFFVEMQNHLIRRVDAKTGIISTVAGTGQQGYAGDGGPAIKAQFSRPHSIALDDNGGLYVADIGNHRIRRIDLKTGIVDSIAGNGEKTLPTDGAAVKGQPILGPRALDIDGQTMWIALREGHSIWKLDLASGKIQHIAGTGKKGFSGDNGPALEATFNGPKGIAVGSNGDVFVCDTENQVIRKIDPQTGMIATVAGAGPDVAKYNGDNRPALTAGLARPHGICVSPSDEIFIGDTLSHRVREVQPYDVSVSTDRENARYETAEPVDFQIDVLKYGQPATSGRVNYTLTKDGLTALTVGRAELQGKPIHVRGVMPEPGFLRCVVKVTPKAGRPLTAIAAAAVSPEMIQPSLPAPEDFDEFWAMQKERLAAVPATAEVTPVKSPDEEIETFDVQVNCLGPTPVSGYLARPKNAAPKSLPALLYVHGSGVRSSSLGNAVEGARMGLLALDINAHGIPNGRPAKFYRDLATGKLKTYRHDGRDSRDTSYFLGMYLRLMRAMDFLTAQPEWDGKILIVSGHSQGGGQSLVAAGLEPRVTAIAVGVPAMCDHSGRVINRINGWPKLVPIDDAGQPEAAALEASRYFDAVNFAARTDADAILSIGFIDAVCPPTTNFAAYNQLRGEKQTVERPAMGHAAPQDIKDEFKQFIRNHIEKQK